VLPGIVISHEKGVTLMILSNQLINKFTVIDNVIVLTHTFINCLFREGYIASYIYNYIYLLKNGH